MNEELDLIDKMRRLASALPCEARDDVRQRLVETYRARHRSRVPKVVLAIAACVLLALGLALLNKRPAAVPDDVYSAPGFIALPYAQSGVPLEHAVVIRVQMRASELSSMGVAVPAAASTAGFQADLLVGQDGVARAVRLVE